jgi:hypothetical protein
MNRVTYGQAPSWGEDYAGEGVIESAGDQATLCGDIPLLRPRKARLIRSEPPAEGVILQRND